MHAGVYLGAIVLIGFALWGATLFWRGRIADRGPPRHETRVERRRLHHKS